MACLFKRGKKFWISFRINGKLLQRSLKTDDRRIAREKIRQLEYELSRGELQNVSRTLLPNILEDFCNFLQTTRTPKSAKNVFNRLRSVFGPVCPSLKHRPPDSPEGKIFRVTEYDKFAGRHLPAKLLEDVTPAALNCWLDTRAQEENWAPKTVNNYRQTLHRLFSYAIKRHNFISRDRRYPNPAGGVERRKEPALEIRFLTIDQIDEQLETLKEYPTIRAIVATLIYAGLRREETTWLTTRDVDLESRLIRVQAKTIDGEFWQPKTKRNRVIPISNALFAILSKFHRPLSESIWFFASPKGKRWDPDNFSHDLRDINRKHNLIWSSLVYRHTFGSHLAQKGESLYKISTLMGNSPEICRKHYAALIPEQMTDVVEFGQSKNMPKLPDDDGAKAMLEKILLKLDGVEDKRHIPQLRIVRKEKPA